MTLFVATRRAARILTFAAMLPAVALAEGYPNKPITMYVAYGAGATTDVTARALAKAAEAALGVPIAVENKGGGGGTVAAGLLASKKPDGYTLLVGSTGPLTIRPLLMKVSYKPENITGIIEYSHFHNGSVVVNANSPWKTIDEFIAYAKTRSGKLNYASAGVGSATHLAMAYFATRAQINVVHVPFKSTAEALNSLIGGDTEALIVPTLGSQAFVANPAIRLLAVVSKQRIPTFLDVPTVDESGLPGFEFTSWFGLLGPAKMPADVTQRLNDAVARTIAIPRVAESIAQQGIEPRPMSSAAFTELLTDNYASMKRIVGAAGIAGD